VDKERKLDTQFDLFFHSFAGVNSLLVRGKNLVEEAG
jgi:hypothetical protein